MEEIGLLSNRESGKLDEVLQGLFSSPVIKVKGDLTVIGV
jgi:hypothetical protein